jgi:hypothetical protein
LSVASLFLTLFFYPAFSYFGVLYSFNPGPLLLLYCTSRLLLLLLFLL